MSLLYKSNRAYWIGFLDQVTCMANGAGIGLMIGNKTLASLLVLLVGFALWMLRIYAYAKYVEGYPVPEARLRLCLTVANQDGKVVGDLKEFIPLKDDQQE